MRVVLSSSLSGPNRFIKYNQRDILAPLAMTIRATVKLVHRLPSGDAISTLPEIIGRDARTPKISRDVLCDVNFITVTSLKAMDA